MIHAGMNLLTLLYCSNCRMKVTLKLIKFSKFSYNATFHTWYRLLNKKKNLNIFLSFSLLLFISYNLCFYFSLGNFYQIKRVKKYKYLLTRLYAEWVYAINIFLSFQIVNSGKIEIPTTTIPFPVCFRHLVYDFRVVI